MIIQLEIRHFCVLLSVCMCVCDYIRLLKNLQSDGLLSPANAPSIASRDSRQVVLEVRMLLDILNCFFIYYLHS